MWRYAAVAALLLLALVQNIAAGQQSEDLIATALSGLTSGTLTVFAPAVRNDIIAKEHVYQKEIASVGKLQRIEIIDEIVLPTAYLVQGRTVHAAGVVFWTVGYSSITQLIETLQFNTAAKAADAYENRAAPTTGPLGHGRWTPSDLQEKGDGAHVLVPSTAGMTIPPIPKDQDSACKTYPLLCREKDARTVEFLFATNRRMVSGQRVSFGGVRSNNLTFGAARVRIPEAHAIGHIELPSSMRFWGYTIYQTKQDEKKHFTIKSVVRLERDDWGRLISEQAANEALIFVHGYNTSFEDALYRHAQIIWDLQYKRGMSILFSWPSRGNVLDYVYDQQSALNARDSFIELLRILRDDYKVEKIHVLAHSMGNLIVLDALANEERTANPLKIAELIMAAPDVDRDYFRAIAPEVRKITAGMTLYASSVDKALTMSRRLARVPRAGDVPPDGPIVLPGIETIDVSAMGDEFLGLNHDVFASNRSVMSDIKAILSSGLRPPSARGEIRGVPEGAEPPSYWRYPR